MSDYLGDVLADLSAAQRKANAETQRANAIQEEYHAYRRDVELDAAVNQPDIAPDNRPHVREYLLRSNARIVENRTVVDGPNDTSPTADERVQQMREAPEQFGNLVGAPQRREPTKQELRDAELIAMPMERYMAERKKGDHLKPQS